MLKNELKLYFKSTKFILLVIIGLLVLFFSGKTSASFFNSIRHTQSFDPNSFGIQLFEQSIYIGGHYFVYMCLIPSLIYSYTYLRDKNTGFGILLISRIGYKKYYFIKASVTLITAFMTQVAILILYLIYCLVIFGSNTIDYSTGGETQLFYIRPWIWLMFIILVFSMFVTTISMISLGLSNMVKKYYLMYPFSVLFIISIVIILNILNSTSLLLGFNIDFLKFIFPLSFIDPIHFDFNSTTAPLFIACVMFYLFLAVYFNIKLYLKDSSEYL